MEPQFPDEFFGQASLPPDLDVDSIRREWLALRPPYHIADRHLPMPVWARRPFTDSGEAAWQTLCRDVPGIDPARAFCIYIHVPFCSSRCQFCDCYSFRLAAHREKVVTAYLDLLEQEVGLWAVLGTLSRRTVSTVHLGGGTPTFLGTEALLRLAAFLRTGFATGPHTEWALESTVSDLPPDMLSCLDSLGFTRLHIGVQSLQDDVRQRIGRRTAAADVLRTICQATEMGWIVSVDLIYGLPGQTLIGLLADIRSLAAQGVSGFSLYELQFSSRNRRFVQQHGLDREGRHSKYLLSQAASRYLAALGYRKTLFNHYADARDTNLYFTFPARGEDCLALGTVADGSFGDYHYRHGEYAHYCRSVGERFPGLEGGLRRNDLENRLQPLTIALLAGSVPACLFTDPGGQALLRRWRESLLLEEDAPAGSYRLTGNGSWFVGNMISEMLSPAALTAPGA